MTDIFQDNILQNTQNVIKNVTSAALRCGRNPSDISIVAASKMNDTARIQTAISAGISICGENRVQEMLKKVSEGAYIGSHLHFIGHLQKNKVKNIIGLTELIHSVDSLSLLETISKEAFKKNITQDILLEINIANEASKTGFSVTEILPALDFADTLSNIHIRGLMAIPPICNNPEENRPFFAQMHQLFIDIDSKKYDNSNMDFLSMGMSGDYEVAINCGSNMIRIGSAIFGPRDYFSMH